MTECNSQPLLFSSLSSQKVTAYFDGGRLSSNAGRLLLREADHRRGLTASLAACITDPRDPAKITHHLRTLLSQRVFGIALRYEDLNDHATLRDDPLFAIFAEQRADRPGDRVGPVHRVRHDAGAMQLSVRRSCRPRRSVGAALSRLHRPDGGLRARPMTVVVLILPRHTLTTHVLTGSSAVFLRVFPRHDEADRGIRPVSLGSVGLSRAVHREHERGRRESTPATAST